MLKVVGTEAAQDEGDGRSLLDEIAREGARRMLGASAREPLRSTGAAFLKMPKKQFDTAVVAQVHQLAADGHSVRQIAKALDIPRSTVGGGLDWRRTAAVATRAPSRPPCASADGVRTTA